MSKPKIYIAGHAGMVGSAITRFLKKKSKNNYEKSKRFRFDQSVSC